MNKGSRFDKVFLLLIPLGIIVLLVVGNFVLDSYYQIKLNKDTKDVLNYLLTKDCETSEECKALAIEQYNQKGYENNDILTTIILGDDYMILAKYNYINDLRVFLNIFHIKVFDQNGNIDDQKIDESLEKKSGMVSSKYIVKLNEYKEPIIEKFKGDENEFFLEQDKKTTTTTTTAVVNE